ncbi:dihydrolipoyl dehydrogenase [Ammoniphilus resinae]|uniref:Dihydrolipoyl dehydrogenase n=1 Tax=Ammoniphilus resinae TaxID=861532 RepID=A0ABS4GTH8_9BACL|nr:dihydrolipoyl dehydrogenase [Ammoniphilus resinae]MBP1933549.1 dihydrolipoamide dehydrogenase [Ammoniphilus resinae]
MPAANEFDLAILGGGIGGYTAAIRASQLGMKVALVEKDKLGGTCLHRGCIPSKALLRSAEVYRLMKQSDEYGIETASITLNFPKMQERKQKIVDQLHRGVQHLLKKGNITVFHGLGTILGPSIFSPLTGSVSVTKELGDPEILVPKHLLLATGSRPREMEGLAFDGEYILSSDHALQLESLPNSMLIVGAGRIGLEWASLLSDLGVDVELVELSDRILPGEDPDISKEMTRILKKRKVKIQTGVTLLPDSLIKKENLIRIRGMVGEQEKEFESEKLLITIGRSANVENIGLENTEIRVEQGVVVVNQMYQTDESHIYAVGDMIGGLQLAHVASREGIIAVEHIAGLQPSPLDPLKVPKVTYSRPEVASIGWSEKEAVAQGFGVKTGIFPFRALGKAAVEGETDGFAKLVVNRETEDLLGIHLIGPAVSNLIAEGTLAQFLDATPWELSQMVHPHPSLAEVFSEAALAVEGKAIHA